MAEGFTRPLSLPDREHLEDEPVLPHLGIDLIPIRLRVPHCWAYRASG
jgi:hypothetical protein